MIRNAVFTIGFVVLAMPAVAQKVEVGTTENDRAAWHSTTANLEKIAAAQEARLASTGSYSTKRAAAELAADLSLDASTFVDGWGRAIEAYAMMIGKAYIVMSAGPDAKPGTGDDLVVRDRLHSDLHAIAERAETVLRGAREYPQTLDVQDKDPWGTPYRYTPAPMRNGFAVTTAGADRRFGTSDDIEMTDATRSDLRSISIALQAFTMDHGTAPEAASVEQLVAPLSPMYIRSLPRRDAWGQEMSYKRSDDGKTFTVSSAGPDTRFGTPDDVTLAE